MNQPQHPTTIALEGTDEQIMALATPFFRALMAAHEEADFDKLEPLLSEPMKAALTREKFDEMIEGRMEGLGGLVGAEFLGSLRKDTATQTLWKARYAASTSDALWQMVLARNGETVEIVGLMFSLP